MNLALINEFRLSKSFVKIQDSLSTKKGVVLVRFGFFVGRPVVFIKINYSIIFNENTFFDVLIRVVEVCISEVVVSMAVVKNLVVVVLSSVVVAFSVVVKDIVVVLGFVVVNGSSVEPLLCSVYKREHVTFKSKIYE